VVLLLSYKIPEVMAGLSILLLLVAAAVVVEISRTAAVALGGIEQTLLGSPRGEAQRRKAHLLLRHRLTLLLLALVVARIPMAAIAFLVLSHQPAVVPELLVSMARRVVLVGVLHLICRALEAEEMELLDRVTEEETAVIISTNGIVRAAEVALVPLV
jgi:hypothetical protein